MKLKTVAKTIFPLLLLLFIFYLFWGPLFPWSPVKPGYKKIRSSGATLFIKDFEDEEVVFRLDEILLEEEAFHALNFHKKFKVIVLGTESNMKRYLPWIKGTGYSVKLGSVNVIYIGATARNSPYGIEVFLKHEISHLLIHQNTPSARKNMELLRQGWLTEGIATFFGGPHYYERNDFVELWKGRGLTFDRLYEANPHEMDSSIIRLKYSYYRFFIEFLINTYGITELQYYLKCYIEEPERYELIFSEVYHEDLDHILQKFKTYMNS
jgi:hypothetical protein